MNIKTQLKNSSSYKVSGMLRIVGPDEPFLGPGRIELMEHIAATGSINKAAKEMGMSYKKAWLMVQSLNRQAETPLIVTQTGGEQGGGAQLSETAQALIQTYRELSQRFEAFFKTRNSESVARRIILNQADEIAFDRTFFAFRYFFKNITLF